MYLGKVQLVDGEVRVALGEEGTWKLLDLLQVDHVRSLADILHAPDPLGLARYLVDGSLSPVPVEELKFLSPVDRQEVWAAGVTYRRSQVARMEESEAGASHYDKVYTAPRPEIFFKATPARVSGPGQALRVRSDSQWSVPEPELALVISPEGKLVGYTVGNDMSARDIEGENPLYLPQAKVYNQCCGLGPWVRLASSPLTLEGNAVRLKIRRGGQVVSQDETHLGMLKRSFSELIHWLTFENDVPQGAFLLTGTGIVPDNNFSLEQGDEVSIEIEGIGTLTNPIVKAAAQA